MEIDELRNIDLDKIMDSLGYEKNRKQSDSKRSVYLTEIGKISIMGSKFYNFSTCAGGGGAIDIIKMIKNYNFNAAINFLKGIGYSEKKKELRAMPEKDDSKINIAFDYLCKRGIPDVFVNSFIRHHAIYANKYGSVVFLHCSFIEYRITGATIRGTNNNFKQTMGDKNDGLFWFGKNIKEAAQVILAESPIDLISYCCLKRAFSNNCYVSLSGIFLPSSLIELLKDRNIILAIDNPACEKSAAAKEANIRLEERLREISGAVIRETPKNKDWNEDLIYKGVKK